MIKNLLKSIVLCLVCAGTSFAVAPWAAREGNPEVDTGVLWKVIKGQKLYVSMEIHSKNMEEDLKQKLSKKYGKMIEDTYNHWLDNALQRITDQHRETEFADVIKILGKKVKIQFVKPATGADVEFYFVGEEELHNRCLCKSCYGCHLGTSSGQLFIFLPFRENFGADNKSLSAIMLHEIGHSLGFGEQYEHPGSGRDVVSGYYNSQNVENIMNNTLADLSCDDADGIVNMIDLAYLQNKKQSLMKGQTWKSLCPDQTTIYQNGHEVGKARYELRGVGIGPFRIMDNPTDVRIYVHNEKNGIVSEILYFDGFDYSGAVSPFSKLKETVLEKDNLDRPVLATTDTKEKVYYFYYYDGVKVRLVTKEKKILLAEMWDYKALKPTTKNHQILYADSGNKSYIRVECDRKKGVDSLATCRALYASGKEWKYNEEAPKQFFYGYDKDNESIYNKTLKNDEQIDSDILKQVKARVENAELAVLGDQLKILLNL